MLINTAALAHHNVESLVTVLKAEGLEAYGNNDLGPSSFHVDIPNHGTLSFAHSFNREDKGWEAVLDIEGDQTPLPDGPTLEAGSLYNVATWTLGLVKGIADAQRVLEGFVAATTALQGAVENWNAEGYGDAYETVATFCNEGFPFDRSLEEVVADLAAYVGALSARLHGEV